MVPRSKYKTHPSPFFVSEVVNCSSCQNIRQKSYFSYSKKLIAKFSTETATFNSNVLYHKACDTGFIHPNFTMATLFFISKILKSPVKYFACDSVLFSIKPRGVR